ncbi:MAG: glycoside hydrolase family 2 protein [Polyangiaceae bacterium]
MARIRAATNHQLELLSSDWLLAEARVLTTETAATSPEEARDRKLQWQPAQCPGTVASALQARGEWDWSSTRNFDGSDFWYRTRFASTPCAAGESLWLELDGLATLADVWLNGSHVLRSENMFCAHELDVSTLVSVENELWLRFSSLDVATAVRRPRPRFKTRLIERQQLRWFRTTLLGRIPGWSPPVAAVGPWREVRVVRRRALSVRQMALRPRVEHGRALVSARFSIDVLGARLEGATLHVGSSSAALSVSRDADGSDVLEAELEVRDAELWWPQGYGAQARYAARADVTVDGVRHSLHFDSLAFRSIAVSNANDGFAVLVNDVEIRCRGACWTPADVVSLGNDAATVASVKQAHAAGMNMLRVGGTMVYESDAFYEECDRSGILVWQDFMFANCDYPGEDEAFRTNVTREAEQFLSRTETRASLAVLCGNSEIEQQVAMLGLPREAWRVPLFEEVLRHVSAARRADVPYVASTPTGGALPFQPNVGLTHYYGVGAYQRPLEDARRAGVRFTPECLGFSNIPEESTIEQVLGEGRAPFHDPRWKARVPRDSGPGWDFDDVRDYYTKLLFGVDPVALRYEDTERALALGRVTSGEVMARTLAEWRRGASSCRGALIWFLRDLWPGAGWGLIDALGVPKAAYYYVKRAMQAQTVFFSDEGLNGLSIHVVNDAPEPLRARLELQLIRSGSVRVAHSTRAIEVHGRGALEVEASTLFDQFFDLTRAYRFGPSQYDVAIATLTSAESSSLVAQACYFPTGLPAERADDLGLEATVEPVSGDEWRLKVQGSRFAYAVAIDVPGFAADDSYFELAPGQQRVLTLRGATAEAKPRGFVRPLNARSPTRVVVGARGGQP